MTITQAAHHTREQRQPRGYDMAQQFGRTWDTKTPATIGDLRNFLTQAQDMGYPDDTKVEVLVNFTRGIKQATVKK